MEKSQERLRMENSLECWFDSLPLTPGERETPDWPPFFALLYERHRIKITAMWKPEHGLTVSLRVCDEDGSFDDVMIYHGFDAAEAATTTGQWIYDEIGGVADLLYT